MSACSAAGTLAQTYAEIPFDIVDDVMLVDNGSNDKTSEAGVTIGIKHIITHEHNRGYGTNQKTCYNRSLALGADVIVMSSPDYQYVPKLIPSLCNLINMGLYPVVLGLRILGNPLYCQTELTNI